jgi:hypothetical protein
MSQSTVPNPQVDVDGLEVAADEANTTGGGDVRETVKAPIMASEYLESEARELMQAASHAYTRGRFKTYRLTIDW